jgi:hypothetical protein
VTGEPDGLLRRVTEGYEPGDPNSARINATILSLVRNNELDGMLLAMRDLERTWNHKFNYPWTFFNDEDFTEEFKSRTRKETKAECRYGMLQPLNPGFILTMPRRRENPCRSLGCAIMDQCRSLSGICQDPR